MPPSDVLVEIGHARKDFGAVGACNRSVFEKFVSAREAELLLEGALPTQDGGGEREREREQEPGHRVTCGGEEVERECRMYSVLFFCLPHTRRAA